MRIGVLGKGGSGKTTVAAALILCASKQQHVLAIDADHNVNLAETLHIPLKTNLADHTNDILAFFRGKRTDLGDQPMIATTPPSILSNFVKPVKNDPFMKKYAAQQGNISIIQAGSYTDNDIGTTCYHGKLKSVELLFHHLLDTDDDLVIADATAGLDSLGHSMYMVHDVIVYVVEPTLKSTGVCAKFIEMSKEKNVIVYVVGNKCKTQEDKTFIETKITGAPIIAYIAESDAVRAHEQGDVNALAKFVDEHDSELKSILAKIKEHKKDWQSYYHRLLSEHKASATSWYDGFHGTPISKQKDPEFTYEKVLREA